jgi:alpha-mannosidase
MDQQQIDTRFRLLAGSVAEDVSAQLILASNELNQPFERFFAYFPPMLPANAPADPAPFLSVEPQTIVLGALKKAEADDALVVRLIETAGQTTTAQARLENASPVSIDFRPFEIRTFKLSRQKESVIWRPCNLLEEG